MDYGLFLRTLVILYLTELFFQLTLQNLFQSYENATYLVMTQPTPVDNFAENIWYATSLVMNQRTLVDNPVDTSSAY